MRSWKPHGGKVQALAFSPDGRTLATAGGASRFVALWDVLTGTETAKLDGHSQPVLAVQFGPDGRHLASVERGGAVLVWTTETPVRVVARLQPTWAESTLSALAFAPTGDRLVAAGPLEVVWWDQPTRPWDGGREPTGHEGRRDRAPANCIGYTPDGSRFLVGATDLEIWQTDLSTPFAFIRATRRAGIRAFTVAPDGSRVAFTLKNAVPVYRFADRTWETTLHWGRDMVHAVTFTRDGRSLLTAGADGTVRFWEVGTWQESRRFDWGIGNVRAVVFSPDGLTCAAGGASGQIVLWDVDA